MRKRAIRAAHRGFTLVETIIALMVISIAVLGVTFALGFSARSQAQLRGGLQALELAEAYAEEIAARRYDENAPPGGVPACDSATGNPCTAADSFDDGESRAEFDDVDDYDGLVDSPPRDALGLVRSGYPGFSVAVGVRYLSTAEVTSLGVDDIHDAKVIDIDVTPPGGTTLRFVTLRGNF